MTRTSIDTHRFDSFEPSILIASLSSVCVLVEVDVVVDVAAIEPREEDVDADSYDEIDVEQPCSSLLVSLEISYCRQNVNDCAKLDT